VTPWEEGGPTSLENLRAACDFHHHLVHLPGWSDKLEPDGTVTITRPDGTTLTRPPRGDPLPPGLFD
jgi:hypothetical protein